MNGRFNAHVWQNGDLSGVAGMDNQKSGASVDVPLARLANCWTRRIVIPWRMVSPLGDDTTSLWKGLNERLCCS